MKIKKMSGQILNNQKPIEHDIHLKYICVQCGQAHWLSMSEASTKRFKIVCLCGNIFGVKRVKDFKLLFHKKNKTQEIKLSTEENSIKQIFNISTELLEQTMGILIGYGFTKTEARKIIEESYKSCPVDSVSGLIKQILESLRNTNVK